MHADSILAGMSFMCSSVCTDEFQFAAIWLNRGIGHDLFVCLFTIFHCLIFRFDTIIVSRIHSHTQVSWGCWECLIRRRHRRHRRSRRRRHRLRFYFYFSQRLHAKVHIGRAHNSVQLFIHCWLSAELLAASEQASVSVVLYYVYGETCAVSG